MSAVGHPPDRARGSAFEAPRTDGESIQRIYVWDLVVRATHWIVAGTIVVLAVTGLYIGSPFLTVDGEAGDHFVMGTMRHVHVYAAILFTLAVLSRIAWMFVGHPEASWRSFIPTTKKRWRGLLRTLRFYLLLARTPADSKGHNPLAGAAYTGVFGLYLVMIVTGLGLYGMQAGLSSPLAVFAPLVDVLGGAQSTRWLHHVVMWLLAGFVIHHVYSAILTAIVEKNGTIDSIISGWKWVRRDQGDGDD